MGGESLGTVATCRSRTPYSPARQTRAYPNLHTARSRRRERALRHARTFRCPHGQCLDPNYRQGVSQFHAFQTAQTAKREYSHTGPGGSPLQRLEPDDHSMQHNMQAYTYKTYLGEACICIYARICTHIYVKMCARCFRACAATFDNFFFISVHACMYYGSWIDGSRRKLGPDLKYSSFIVAELESMSFAGRTPLKFEFS